MPLQTLDFSLGHVFFILNFYHNFIMLLNLSLDSCPHLLTEGLCQEPNRRDAHGNYTTLQTSTFEGQYSRALITCTFKEAESAKCSTPTSFWLTCYTLGLHDISQMYRYCDIFNRNICITVTLYSFFI